MTLTVAQTDLIAHMLRTKSAANTAQAMATAGTAISVHQVDSIRRALIASGDLKPAPGTTQLAPRGLSRDATPLVDDLSSRRAAQTTQCEALYRRTVEMFEAKAARDGCTLEEAALALHHGPGAVARWRAAA